MRTSTKRPKAERHPRLVEAEVLVKAHGHKTVSKGLRAVDLDRQTYNRAVKEGLTDNPRSKTIERLRALGGEPLLELCKQPA